MSKKQSKSSPKWVSDNNEAYSVTYGFFYVYYRMIGLKTKTRHWDVAEFTSRWREFVLKGKL